MVDTKWKWKHGSFARSTSSRQYYSSLIKVVCITTSACYSSVTQNTALTAIDNTAIAAFHIMCSVDRTAIQSKKALL
jgi:hypothetical protein